MATVFGWYTYLIVVLSLASFCAPSSPKPTCGYAQARTEWLESRLELLSINRTVGGILMLLLPPSQLRVTLVQQFELVELFRKKVAFIVLTEDAFAREMDMP